MIFNKNRIWRPAAFLLSVIMTFMMTAPVPLDASSSAVIGYELPHYHEEVVYNGGWRHHAGNKIYFFDIDGEDNIGYCLEPGRHRSDDQALDLQDVPDIIDGTSVMTAEEETETLERILFYGYGGGYYCDDEGSARGLDTNSPEDPDNNLYFAVATQILIWEVVVGEVDYCGNWHSTGAANVAITIFGESGDQDAEERDFHLKCDYWYHKIANRVFSDNIYDPVTGAGSSFGCPRPSFSSMTRSGAPEATVDSGLHVALNDTNGDISDYDFSNITFFEGTTQLPPDRVSWHIDGDMVDITFAPDVDIDNAYMRMRSNVRGRCDLLIYDDDIYGEGDNDDNLQAVAISGGGFSGITCWVGFRRPSAEVGLKKTSSSSGDIISGISFLLENMDTGDTYSGTTRSDGSLVWAEGSGTSLEVMPGSYKITETLPVTYLECRDQNRIPYTYNIPEGWTPGTSGTCFYEFDLYDGDDVTITCANIRNEAELVITKISEDDDPSGITFDLYYRGNETAFDDASSPRYLVGSYETSSEGIIQVGDLPYGWYEIEERTPDFFVCSYEGGQTSSGNKLVHLTSDDPWYTEAVTAVNSIRAQIVINKTDGWTGSSVGGTSFDLYRDVNENGVLEEDEMNDPIRMTDEDGDGKIVFDNVEAGYYFVSEAETVDGYYINDAVFPVAVSRGQEYEIDVEDIPYNVFVRIIKTDEDDEDHYLTGASFEIFEDTDLSGEYEEGEDQIAVSFDGNSMVQVGIEEATGCYVTTEPLLPGTYFIVETSAPEGFSITEDYVTVIVDRADTRAPDFTAEDMLVNITNRCRGDLHITKTDELYPDNKLTGAVFTVFDSEWNIVGTMTEETAGEYYMRDLPWGDYFVEETKAPEGFTGSDQIYEASIRYDGEMVDITDEGISSVANTCYGDITVYKVDEADHQASLTGALFDIWIDCDGDGQIGGSDVFYSSLEDHNGDGVYTMTLMPRGRYVLCEVSAPEGYERDPNCYPFEIRTEELSLVIDNSGYDQLDTEDGLFVNGRSIVTTTLSENGEKVIDPEEDVTISDNVFYQGLIPGLEYELTGKLIDKSTMEEITTTTMTFTPEEGSGMVKISFTFDAADLAGEDIVCFEYMYRDGHEVGLHADIEAEGQTVTVGTPQKTDIPATGEKANTALRLAGAGASALSLMMGLIWFTCYKRKE